MRARRIGAAVAVALSLAVFLSGPARAGGGCHRSLAQGQTEGTGTTVEMAGNCFATTVLRESALSRDEAVRLAEDLR